MIDAANPSTITRGSMELRWSPETRVADLRFSADTKLDGKYGGVLVDALRGWIGASGTRFALLADAKGVVGTDAGYRAVTGEFFRQHRDTARIALVNLHPVIRVVAEMFRVAARLHLKTFPDEIAARAWLRAEGLG